MTLTTARQSANGGAPLSNNDWLDIAKFVGGLLGGGTIATLGAKIITGGDAKLVDSAAVRNELWKRLEALEVGQRELQTKYENEHDHRVRLEGVVQRVARVYEDVRVKVTSLIDLLEKGDEAWRVHAAELKRAPPLEELLKDVGNVE